MEKKYLSINQLAKACSTSRSTILRMEADKILTPAYINPDNGYRYYNEANVLRVARNISFQELGITHMELSEYYNSSQNYDALLNKLQTKMAMMEYQIANIKLQLGQDEHLAISHFYFPELYCYTYTMKNITDLSLVRPKIWDVFNDAIQLGFSVNRQMHPYVLVDYESIIRNNYVNTGYDYEICIPVIPGKNDIKLKHFEATDTISSIMYGGSADIKKAFEKITDELGKNKTAPKGAARVLSIVSSIPGETIPAQYWVSRVCVPI